MPLEYPEFIQLVTEMRQAQRNYFAVRCPSNLNEAKAKEKEVDKAIREWELRDAPKQGNLIGGK